jgi:hypothetical protein
VQNCGFGSENVIKDHLRGAFCSGFDSRSMRAGFHAELYAVRHALCRRTGQGIYTAAFSGQALHFGLKCYLLFSLHF